MLHQAAHHIIFEGTYDIIFEGAHDIISEGTDDIISGRDTWHHAAPAPWRCRHAVRDEHTGTPCASHGWRAPSEQARVATGRQLSVARKGPLAARGRTAPAATQVDGAHARLALCKAAREGEPAVVACMATSARGLGLTPPHLHRDLGSPPPTSAPGLGLTPPTSAPGLKGLTRVGPAEPKLARPVRWKAASTHERAASVGARRRRGVRKLREETSVPMDPRGLHRPCGPLDARRSHPPARPPARPPAPVQMWLR
jgi:hypothetical protein